MDDSNLEEGWYRFSSYDNVTIPESVVPRYRCSGWSPGWLNGSHPSVEDGEVNRTVCFHWVNHGGNDDTCPRHQEIKIKKCSSYFVYFLKPISWSYSVYCADSVHSDPCVNHTVLDQPWRSTNCTNTQCTNGKMKSDKNLAEAWYRFNSSGGWKIPETTIRANHCSGKKSGWLNVSQPWIFMESGDRAPAPCFPVSGRRSVGCCPHYRRDLEQFQLL
ncbi:pancreatic secretory granule membrane major glycoprotein GP2-like [Amblyraja radiata]|uniref:pancreatic secretory granule membrane major glycoprotein GP2-like n=1 Tax=Amblyraja radiata TaxID=386614 RepID=UPI001402A2A7|nr:pancreatic secretory granule membrane major glycoprotein GP2-like [Amblyraja radiata]